MPTPTRAPTVSANCGAPSSTNFGYLLTFGDGTRVTIEYVESQSGYHRWNINGRPGFGVEFNRDSLHGATLDLKQTIEWDSSPSAKRSR